MQESIDNLIDDLVEAINDENAQLAKDLFEELLDEYDEITPESQKRIRKATLLRGNDELTEEEEKELAELVDTSADTKMRRVAFSLQILGALEQIKQDGGSQIDVNEGATDIKQAEDNLEQQTEDSQAILDETDAPPSVEILNLKGKSGINVGETTKLEATLGNVGDEPADDIEIVPETGEGVSVRPSSDSVGNLSGGEDIGSEFELTGTETGVYTVTFDLSTKNAGSDSVSTDIAVNPDEAEDDEEGRRDRGRGEGGRERRRDRGRGDEGNRDTRRDRGRGGSR